MISHYIGGNIAASWAILNVTGVDGYMSMTAQLMNITDILKQGITQITVSVLINEVS